MRARPAAQVRVDGATWARLVAYRRRHGVPMARVVAAAVRAWCEARGEAEPERPPGEASR